MRLVAAIFGDAVSTCSATGAAAVVSELALPVTVALVLVMEPRRPNPEADPHGVVVTASPEAEPVADEDPPLPRSGTGAV